MNVSGMLQGDSKKDDGVEEDGNIVINGLAIHPEFNRTLHIAHVAHRDLRHEYFSASTPCGS